MRAAMVEAAWTTARTRTRPGARLRRLARRFGRRNEKKAAVAVAHTLTCIAWVVMTRDQDYADAGEDYYEQRGHLIRHHQQAPARLSCHITITPPGDSHPPPATPPDTAPATPPDPYRDHRRPPEPAPPALPRAS